MKALVLVRAYSIHVRQPMPWWYKLAQGLARSIWALTLTIKARIADAHSFVHITIKHADCEGCQRCEDNIVQRHIEVIVDELAAEYVQAVKYENGHAEQEVLVEEEEHHSADALV